MSNSFAFDEGRIAYFDNAKGILIWIVVLTHLLGLLFKENTLTIELYDFFGSFATSTFAFLSGVFSRAELTPGRAWKTACTTLLPYCFFQVAFQVCDHVLKDTPLVEYNLFTPFFALWYLLAFFTWSLLLPFFAALRFPFVTALLVGFAAGFMPHSLAQPINVRTFVMLPVFVLGWKLGQHRERLMALTDLRCRLGAAIVLVIGMVLFQLFAESKHWDLILPRLTIQQLKMPPGDWLVARSIIYAASFLFGAALLSLTPRRRSFLSAIGRRSFYVYILHIPFVFFARHAELQNRVRIAFEEYGQVFVAAGVAAVLTCLLALKPVAMVFKPFIEPNPETMRRITPLLVAAAFPLALIPSFNYLGARLYRTEEIPNAANAKPSATMRPREVGSSGMLVKLDTVSRTPNLRVSFDCAARYDLEFFNGKERKGQVGVTVASANSVEEIVLPRAVSSGWNLVAIRPSGNGGCSGKSHLRLFAFGGSSKVKP